MKLLIYLVFLPIIICYYILFYMCKFLVSTFKGLSIFSVGFLIGFLSLLQGNRNKAKGVINMRNGDYLNTYSGKTFYIVDPHTEDISELDIAHALSLTCRANGHFKHFYSIAQHSLNCFYEAQARGYSKRVQLACLLHDGSEAYISDITRPAKHYLPDYLHIEKQIQTTIYNKYGLTNLTNFDVSLISDVDDTVLWYEFESLHNMELWCDKPPLSSKVNLDFRDMKDVENEFIIHFSYLIKELDYETKFAG